MRFNLILLQMLSSDPRIFLAQANANDGKLELHSPPSSLLPTQGTHGDSAVRARPSAPSTHFSLPSPPSSLLLTLDAHCKVTTHYLLLSPPSSLPWTPTAKCPRTFPSPLLPPPYFGHPLQSDHALLPPHSSLLPTLQARPSAPSTHYLLLSSPYSLLTIKLL